MAMGSASVRLNTAAAPIRVCVEFEQDRDRLQAEGTITSPQCTEADFASTAPARLDNPKYARMKGPAAADANSSSRPARCFCGAAIDCSGTDEHDTMR